MRGDPSGLGLVGKELARKVLDVLDLDFPLARASCPVMIVYRERLGIGSERRFAW